MNVLETLENELKEKNWDNGTKARYLYLRCCELFSFDVRYNYYKYLEDFGSEIEAKLSLLNRKIDLENVLDFRVVCTSYSKEVYSKLSKELLGIPCTVSKPGASHVFPTFLEPINGIYQLEADATKSDLAREKMGLKTTGYMAVDDRFRKGFQARLEKIDDTIGYRKQGYANEVLKQQAGQYYQDFLLNHNTDNREMVLDTMYEIKKVFEGFGGFSIYSDAKFCMNHLQELYLKKLGYTNEMEIPLFQFRDNYEIDFIDLYPIKVENERIFFALEKDEYVFHKIKESEAKQYMKKMRCVTNKS